MSLTYVIADIHGRYDLLSKAWDTGRLVVGIFSDTRAGGPIGILEVTDGTA